jgi:hypothetical protein
MDSPKENIKEITLSAHDIGSALVSYFHRYKRHPIALQNAFFNRGKWEADVLSVVSKTEYVYEYEIKLSKSDFKADFRKKEKHEALLNNGYIEHKIYKYIRGDKPGKIYKEVIQVDKIKLWIPNRFYYVCPEGILEKSDMPKYAGLIYMFGNTFVNSRSFEIIKRAPLLHKESCTKSMYRNLAIKLMSRKPI